MRSRPDVLVLGGGGVLGEAWMMGVLAGIEDATGFDLRDCESFVGTSAGSIVAAHLVAGRSPAAALGGRDRARRRPRPARPRARGRRGRGGSPGRLLRAGRQLDVRPARPWGGRAPAGAVLRSFLLRGLPRPADTLAALRSQIEATGARFDGRLRVTAVDRGTGRRVVFGGPGAPDASVAQAVEASCTGAVAVRTGEDRRPEYVDGGVWSPTNLDAAPAGHDTHVLCLNPMASLSSAQTLLAVIRNVSRSAVSVEGLALRRRGAALRTVAPNAECAAAMGSNFMDSEPRGRVLAAGYRQGLLVAADNRGRAVAGARGGLERGARR